MSFALLQPATRSLVRSDLCVERTNIHFINVAFDQLAIAVTVQNLGEARSEPTVAVMQSAPLGAFVPWQPLTRLAVPALKPGESVVLRTEVRYQPPSALGAPGRVPPRRVLTALGMDDQRPRRAGQLAGDLFRLLGQGGFHWAGNLNVFIGGKDVERHLAQALRVYPGRTNLAMFVVGSHRKDAYAFHLTGDAADWDARLFDMSRAESCALDVRTADAVGDDEWLELRCGGVMLALVPPPDARAGSIAVHVRQSSTGREAVVEFSLDASAAGPGCYVV
jgi:hypothetical protein